MLRILEPPPPLTVSEWAEEYRFLSPETAAEPGRWNNDRAPYQKGIMDAIHEPGVEQIVVMSSAQVGKTEAALNIIGYHVHMDPAPIMIVVPTLEIARHYVQDRILPMFRDSPVLQSRLSASTKRRRGQHNFHLQYKGGHITIAGANSPASLATRPIRILILDEVDRFPMMVGAEGDPIALARKRTQAYWNRKIIMISTPTLHGISRIELEYEKSDQRKFYVPCPHCGEYQILLFARIQYEENNPDSARYICEFCGQPWTDRQKVVALKRGVWRKTNENVRSIAGFWLNELYSPFATWSSIVASYLSAKQLQTELRVFYNTVLGEPWSDVQLDEDLPPLERRVERYGPELPESVCVLTAAVDVHEDRLEALVVGWGRGEEAWHIDHRVFYGTPVGTDVWQQLARWLIESKWQHPSGASLTIQTAVIDSGFLSKRVYDFVREYQRMHIYAIKGVSTQGAPIVGRPMRTGSRGVIVIPVSVPGVKDLLFARLQIDRPGPGYIHFNQQCDRGYFDQLTAERPVVRIVKGVAIRQWQKIRERNEILDLWVYNIAALAILNPDFESLYKSLRTEKKEDTKPQQQQSPFMRRRIIARKSWVSDW